MFTNWLTYGIITYNSKYAVLSKLKQVMETKYLQFNSDDLTIAGELIRKGCLVAFPTETVYGLGANTFDANAVKNIYVAKGRPSDNPLISHIWDKSQIYELAREISPDAEKIIDRFMPGSITVVLPKKDTVPDVVTAGLDTVAIRMPKSSQAREFLRYAGVPVAAPSANISGRPSPTTWETVKQDMDGRISAILCGEPCAVGIESTVLDLSRDEPVVLRPGAVSAQRIGEVLGKTVRVLNDPTSKVNSPGVRYKHYAPKVPMVLDLTDDHEKLKAYYDQKVREGYNPVLLVHHPFRYGKRNAYAIGMDTNDVARGLYESLRYLETRYDFIIASFCNEEGTLFDGELGVGIVDRLTKAAGGNII